MGQLHPRNAHIGRYDIPLLCKSNPELSSFVTKNPSGEETIDFAQPAAVLALNKALLTQFYDVKEWAIPDGFLCPPVPGRADYIHYAADLLANSNAGKIPIGKKVKVLDIGTGANVIYPIIGSQTYGWQFVGTELADAAFESAFINVESNANLKAKVQLRKQPDPNKIFANIVKPKDKFALSICNPPFHASAADASASSTRKNRNLHSGKPQGNSPLNFGGQQSELWCDGGEVGFINRMINESETYKNNICWFSCLVSKRENLDVIQRFLKKKPVKQIEIVQMSQGQKVSRFVAWTYQSKEKQLAWFN